MERIISSLCYIVKDGKVLMLYRNKKENDINQGKWIGVGGHFEPGESPEECVDREVLEETGLILDEKKYRGFISFSTEKNEYEYISLFTATKFHGNMIPCDEGQLKWIAIEDIMDLNLWEGDRIFLRLLQERDDFFSLKLAYNKDHLVQAILDGEKDLLSPEF